jgi:hypothetical protein
MGSAARRAPSADHPLLVQLADDFDQHSCQTASSAPSRPRRRRPLCHQGQDPDQQRHDGLIFNWATGDRRMLVAGGDGVGLSRLGFWLGRSHGRCVVCRRIGPGPSRTAPRGGPRLSRNRGADGGDGAMMRVDAKGNELIVI